MLVHKNEQGDQTDDRTKKNTNEDVTPRLFIEPELLNDFVQTTVQNILQEEVEGSVVPTEG